MARKYAKAASAKVGRAMKKRKAGTLNSGHSGTKVTSRKQAIAIGLSEARAEGSRVPKQPAGAKTAKKVAKTKASANTAAKTTKRKTAKLKSTSKAAKRKASKRKATSKRKPTGRREAARA